MPSSIAKFSQYKDDQPVRVKLFGLGSAGCNMIEGAGNPTLAFSTSSADIARSHADRKVLIGPERLIGLSNTKHGILKHVPSIAGHELVDVFNNTDIAFLFCGLGGLTGSLGTRLLASVGTAKGILTVVLAATPFSAESERRRQLASKTIAELLDVSDLCIEFSNDALSSLAPNLPISRAFGLMNGIMQRPVIDCCSAMTHLDAGVLRHVLVDSRYGRFGLGLARGDDRIARVVDEALLSPWFDFPLDQATAAIAVYSSSDPWDKEAEAICSKLAEKLPAARIAWGSYKDGALKDRIRLSLTVCRRRN